MQVSAAVLEPAATPSGQVDSSPGNVWDAFAQDVYKFHSASAGQAEVEAIEAEVEAMDVPTRRHHEEADNWDDTWRDPGPARSDEERSDC